MNAKLLKEKILEENRIEDVLNELGCHHIKQHGDYITCGNPDGNNQIAITVYINDSLNVVDYTRQLSKTKCATDIFDLISYFKGMSFPEALKWTCDFFGIDYYSEQEEIPESLQILQILKAMKSGYDIEDNTQLKPIPEKILTYYIPYGNKMFEDDGISIEIQKEFEIGLDPASNYITIPLRDAVGTLVGIKGRYFGQPDGFHSKYTHLVKCAKSKLLYGYYQNKEYIKNSKTIYVFESEKAVMQMATIGIRNCVATGSKTISKTQVEFIERTGCIPIICYDSDVGHDELVNISDMFIDGIDVYAIVDELHILDEKESPSDNIYKWEKLIKNHICKITKEGN